MITRQQIIMAVYTWREEVEASVVTPAHPLVAVQEGHLAEGGSAMSMKETRARGRSHPPIRDISREATQTGRIMAHVEGVDKKYALALTNYALLGSLEKAAEAMEIGKPTLFRYLDCGIAVYKSGHWLGVR